MTAATAPRLGPSHEGAGHARTRVLDRVRRTYPEMFALAALAAVLNLWNLSRNDWANTFYSGAVRSMASSWHDFLFASLDRSGLMTVDKPPAALWVQALSARIFGFHPLSLLVPEALMGVAAVLLAADLTRRLFGRAAGFVAGLGFAVTPISVAMARHNNPDELLILCCVAGMWCAVRGFQDGRTRWLVWGGALIGLGFETKMAVALFVVPGIAVAWLWLAPAGRGAFHAFGQLLWAGLALAAVGLAWPLLVTLTPAADRPWISGTTDNSVWSLIVGYNGLGRVAGQAGSTGGGGGFGGGSAGPFRLLDASLGGQAGWLLGFAAVSGVGVLAVTRMRRADPRTAWVLAVGGAALVSAIVFSAASGIFHPYYVSFLAPWVAMLVGAGIGQALSGDRVAQIIGVLAVAGGAVSELVVLGGIQGSVGWAKPLVIVVCALCAVALGLRRSARLRAIAVGAALAALLAAPAAWAVETLGHATSSTFPAGGPSDASSFGGGFGPGSGGRGFGGRFGGAPGAGRGTFPGGGSSQAGSGSGGAFPGGSSSGGALPGAGSSGRTGSPSAGGLAGGGPSFGSDSSAVTAAARYAKSHGGGTVGVESQSSAAAAILAGSDNVAGLGGFSGVESSVSVGWLATDVRDGHLRWLLADSSSTGRLGGGGVGRAGASPPGNSSRNPFGSPTNPFGTTGGRSGRTPFPSGRGGITDGRTGSEKALAIAEKVARKVTITVNGTTVTLYDLKGKAAAMLAAADGSTSSSSGSQTV